MPLFTTKTIIEQISPNLPQQGGSGNTGSALATIAEAEVRGIDPSPIRVHFFEWNPLSLGWYQSLLWGFVYTSEMLVSKGTAGVWNGTAIKLFKVQETAALTPSLLAPRGAVDAVGNNLVQRIHNLNLRGGTAGNPAQSASQRNSCEAGNGASTVRDV